MVSLLPLYYKGCIKLSDSPSLKELPDRFRATVVSKTTSVYGCVLVSLCAKTSPNILRTESIWKSSLPGFWLPPRSLAAREAAV